MRKCFIWLHILWTHTHTHRLFVVFFYLKCFRNLQTWRMAAFGYIPEYTRKSQICIKKIKFLLDVKVNILIILIVYTLWRLLFRNSDSQIIDFQLKSKTFSFLNIFLMGHKYDHAHIFKAGVLLFGFLILFFSTKKLCSKFLQCFQWKHTTNIIALK